MKYKRFILIITIIISLFYINTNAYWYIEVLDSDEKTGVKPSITIDSDNDPHISYQRWSSEDLKYAKFSNNIWIIVFVDTNFDLGSSSSIKLDSNDYPHISYFDYSSFP